MLEAYLTEDQQILLSEILTKNEILWHLPLSREDNFVGFGSNGHFFLFWIAFDEEGAYFKSRTQYQKKSKDNTVRHPFIPEHKAAIFALIERICAIAKAAEQAIHDTLSAPLEKKKPVWVERAKKADSQKTAKAILFAEKKAEQERLSAIQNAKITALTEAASRALATRNTDTLPTADVCEELAERAADLAQTLSDAVTDLLSLLSTQRKREISDAYLEKSSTLRGIASLYDCSGERIRQISDRALNSMKKRYHIELREGRMSESADKLTRILTDTNEYLIPLLHFAEKASTKKFWLLLTLLFTSEAIKQLKDEVRQFEKLYRAAAKGTAAFNTIDIAPLATLREKICNAEWGYHNIIIETKPLLPAPTFSYLTRFRKIIAKLPDVISVLEQPDIVYLKRYEDEFRPNFLLTLEDGCRVLVLVQPTLSLAYHYNRARFAEFCRFCQREGYAYIISDERLRTYEEVHARPVSTTLIAELNKLLNEKGAIHREDIQKLKITLHFSYLDIVAFVLQNDLLCGKNPFYIAKPNPKQS